MQVPINQEFLQLSPDGQWRYCNQAAINYMEVNKGFEGREYIKAVYLDQIKGFIYPLDNVEQITFKKQ